MDTFPQGTRCLLFKSKCSVFLVESQLLQSTSFFTTLQTILYNILYLLKVQTLGLWSIHAFQCVLSCSNPVPPQRRSRMLQETIWSPPSSWLGGGRVPQAGQQFLSGGPGRPPYCNYVRLGVWHHAIVVHRFLTELFWWPSLPHTRNVSINWLYCLEWILYISVAKTMD